MFLVKTFNNIIIITTLCLDISTEVCWTEKNYPDLCMPISPCITLQWCFRDGKLVNLPWALLVPGDIVVLQPSQKIVAECYLLEVKKSSQFPLCSPLKCLNIYA